MIFFADTFLKPYIIQSRYRNICEIGAQYGKNTSKLLEVDSVMITVIDPCLDEDLCKKYQGNQRIQVYKEISLEALQRSNERFDCILIDGDHNWYTVYNELKTIHERGLIKEGGTIFFHDVGWPYGRRDMYYQPELIPEEFTHPYERKGVVHGQSELSDAQGINAHVCNATYEGGPKNGVLTAIEDFLKENRSKYAFFYVNAEYGLGALFRKTSGMARVTFWKYLLKAKVFELVNSLKGVTKRVRLLKRSLTNPRRGTTR